jgi:hypothetical protein
MEITPVLVSIILVLAAVFTNTTGQILSLSVFSGLRRAGQPVSRNQNPTVIHTWQAPKCRSITVANGVRRSLEADQAAWNRRVDRKYGVVGRYNRPIIRMSHLNFRNA